MSTVKRALLSVHDKTGVVDFAKGLAGLGVEILSTGGTAKLLRDSGVPVVDVAQVTGFPEMLDGRVKTLHPKVHGGILARRDTPAHMQALESHGIGPIDLVVVALYPFEQTVARPGVTVEEAIENIDIGGPSMIRGAAKNHGGVGVSRHSQYAPCSTELKKSGGALSPRRAPAWRSKPSGAPPSTTPPSPPTLEVAPQIFPSASRSSPSGSSTSGTARTRTRRPRSIARRGPPWVSRPPSSCTGRSCPTTTCSTGRRPSGS